MLKTLLSKKLIIIILCFIFIEIISCDCVYSSISTIRMLKNKDKYKFPDENEFIYFNDKTYKDYRQWRKQRDKLDRDYIYAGEISETGMRRLYILERAKQEGREFERKAPLIFTLVAGVIAVILIYKKARNN